MHTFHDFSCKKIKQYFIYANLTFWQWSYLYIVPSSKSINANKIGHPAISTKCDIEPIEIVFMEIGNLNSKINYVNKRNQERDPRSTVWVNRVARHWSGKEDFVGPSRHSSRWMDWCPWSWGFHSFDRCLQIWSVYKSLTHCIG